MVSFVRVILLIALVGQGAGFFQLPAPGWPVLVRQAANWCAVKRVSLHMNLEEKGSKTIKKEEKSEGDYDLVGAVMERREILAAGLGVLAVATVGSGLGSGVDSASGGTAVAKMRARRKAMGGDELAAEQLPTEAASPGSGLRLPKKLELPLGDAGSLSFDTEELTERVGKAEKDIEEAGQRVRAGATSAYATAKSVGQGVATAATSAYKAGQTVVKTADEVLDIVVPAAKAGAERAAPIIQKGVDTAVPMIQGAYTKASPYVQQALDKADPTFDRIVDSAQPALRSTKEAIDKMSNDPTLTSAVTQTRAQFAVAQETIKPTLPFFAAVADMLMDAAVWFGKFVGVVVKEGADGAKEELLDTLQYQAGSAAQLTKEVVLPAAKQAGQVGVKALGEAATRAMESPNGQALSQKVTTTVSEITSQKDAAITGMVQGVQTQTDKVLSEASGAIRQIKIPSVDVSNVQQKMPALPKLDGSALKMPALPKLDTSALKMPAMPKLDTSALNMPSATPTLDTSGLPSSPPPTPSINSTPLPLPRTP